MSNLFEFVDLGGPIVVILMFVSVIALALIMVKVVQFWRLGVGRHRKARLAVIHWRSGERERAISLLSRNRSMCGKILQFAVGELRRSDHDERHTLDEVEARVREEATAFASDELLRLSAGVRFLDIIAQVSPLLGLLGTVIGMIDAFRALQATGRAVDPSLLAGGIWVALLTTAAGIIVAIPAMIASVWFEGRLERERSTIEVLLTGLFASRS